MKKYWETNYCNTCIRCDLFTALLSAVQTMEEVVACFRKIQAFRRVKDAVYFQVWCAVAISDSWTSSFLAWVGYFLGMCPLHMNETL